MQRQQWRKNGKLKKIPAWQLTKVRNKKDAIDGAKMKGAKVHFASQMDICHLKNAELESKHKKYKGRVVLRGDIVKDDSGSYGIYWTRTICISNDSRKSHGHYNQASRMFRTSSRCSISLHPGQNGRCTNAT